MSFNLLRTFNYKMSAVYGFIFDRSGVFRVLFMVIARLAWWKTPMALIYVAVDTHDADA